MNLLKQVYFPRMPLRFFVLSALGGWTIIVCLLIVITWINERIQIEERAHMLARTIYHRDARSTMLLGAFLVSIADSSAASDSPFTISSPPFDTSAFLRHLPFVNTRTVKNVPPALLADLAPIPIRSRLISLDSTLRRYAGTAWERRMIGAFPDTESEYSEIFREDDGGRYLRFIGALRDEPSCRHCHDRKDYREGTLRGAMSVTVPIDVLWQTQLQHRTLTFIILGCVWLTGLVWITLMHRGMTHRIKERDEAREESLRAAHDRSVAESALAHSVQQLLDTEKRLHAEKLRTEIAGNLHDDIGATLSSMSIFSELLSKEIKGASPRALKLLSRIKYNLLTVQLNLHDIVWAINPGNDTLETVLLKLQEYASDLFGESGITLRSDIASVGQSIPVSMEMRKELLLIFKEACNNIVRHADAHEVRLTAHHTPGRLHLSIADDGKGMPPRPHGNGNGLTNMKHRAETISGTVRIDSAVGTGTTVHIDVPIA